MRPELLRALGRYFPLITALVGLLFWPARWAAADSVELVSGEVVTGVVRSVDDGKVMLDIARPAPVSDDKLFNAILNDKNEKPGKAAPKPEELRTVPLIDVVHIKFEPVFDRSQSTPALVDNDPARNGRPATGTIKLRAGYHRFVLVYWHRSGAAFVRLAQSRVEKPNEDRQRFIRGDMLAHLGPGGTETPSAGVDNEGYRLPETLSGGVLPNARYSLRRRSSGQPFEKVADVLEAGVSEGHGIVDRITTDRFPEEHENLAMLISGYLHIKEDGLYKFVLASDGGSQLYVGETPGGLRSVNAAPPAPWILTLVEGGNLRGTIEKWTNSEIGLSMAGGRSRVAVSIPSARVAKIWSNKGVGKAPSGKDDKFDRSSVPLGRDVVFARSASGAVQPVPGRVQGIQGESLVLLFQGESRKIALSKVAGIVLASFDREAVEADGTFHQIAETYGGIKIPGHLISLDATVMKLRTSWGELLTLKTDDVTGISVKNGKAISLTELRPSQVKQVPFFDRMIRYRVNESLSGGPILLRDGKHSRGISVHAKTVLSYAIGGRFQRFRAKLGFQLPEGELGDASVRVLGDDRPLFVRPSLRGDGPIEPIDLDVTGISTLTLAVDFGRHEDVGDRVVWADPTLIRNATGPIANAHQ